MRTERRRSIAWAFAPMLLAISGGCGWGESTGVVSPDRGAKAGEGARGADPSTSIVYVSQNWTPRRSEEFYFTPQGSQVLPYDWFLKLELAGDETPLRDDGNLVKFGLLLQKKSELNPDALPVGFARDPVKPLAYLGLTCAACHTAQLDYNNVGYRIDGGPSLADVRGFLVAVADSLKATLKEPDKFDRFAKALAITSESGKEDLKKELAIVIERRDGYNVRNFAEDAPPGNGRVDAFGAILNEVFHAAAKLPPGSSDLKANTEPANAPVSYPCLWDTPQHDLLQWNGVAKNQGLGALGRNVGEVLGVFGRLDIPDPPGILGYQSSVRIQDLRSLETWITSLWSPRWPEAIKPLDVPKRDRGAKVFAAAKCGECHLPIVRDDRERKVVAQMKAVQTDDTMAVNFLSRRSKTGKLEGALLKYLPDSLHPERFGPDAGADDMLSQVVIGTIVGSWKDAPRDELQEIEYKRRKRAATGAAEIAVGTPGPNYKARPLNGVWATAPYLHNGSVPTLYDLLLPAKDRPKAFHVGSREFDPIKVGLKEAATGFLYKTRDDKGDPLPGNSNAGHEFAGALGDDDRWALVEYLKSL